MMGLNAIGRSTALCRPLVRSLSTVPLQRTLQNSYKLEAIVTNTKLPGELLAKLEETMPLSPGERAEDSPSIEIISGGWFSPATKSGPYYAGWLDGGDVTSQYLNALPHLKSVTSLTLKNLNLNGDHLEKLLVNMSNVRKITIINCPKIGEAQSSYAIGFPQVEQLRIEGCFPTKKGLNKETLTESQFRDLFPAAR